MQVHYLFKKYTIFILEAVKYTFCILEAVKYTICILEAVEWIKRSNLIVNSYLASIITVVVGPLVYQRNNASLYQLIFMVSLRMKLKTNFKIKLC